MGRNTLNGELDGLKATTKSSVGVIGVGRAMRKFSYDLPTAEKIEYWREVEGKIRKLLESLVGRVSPACREHTLEYLDANELALALDGICYDLNERRTPILQAHLEQFEELFDQMDYAPTTRDNVAFLVSQG